MKSKFSLILGYRNRALNNPALSNSAINIDHPVNQSNLDANYACFRRKARENVCERVALGFGFYSLKNTALILELFLNECCTVLVESPMT